jgi:hypothetical protein
MRHVRLLPLFLLLPFAIYSQKPVVNPYALIDKKASQLPDSLTGTTVGIAGYISKNFQGDNDRARAIFTWIATHIEYDAANMFAINFYETKQDKIDKPLKTRKGICENYAALFSDVCNKAGIRTYIIEGYTKQNGFTDYIPHAWCAAFIDGAWYMFDPTWGSGYISGGKFFKKINNTYYKAYPEVLIKSHMPFDYLWQFLHYPVTSQEFYEGKTQEDKSKPLFSYKDSIEAYEKQGYIDQLKSAAGRIEKNGVKNAMIFDRLQHIKIEIENDRQQKMIDQYNDAVSEYNQALSFLNDFIKYWNKQFTPIKPDNEIQAMIDLVDAKLKSSMTKLDEIKEPNASIASSSGQLIKAMNETVVQVKEQQDWLKVYFSKNKSGRKSMFYQKKPTWFGIPLK